MSTQSFLIGPIKEGTRKDVKPWALPEDAFEIMTNAYQFRGRIVRRQGYNLLGRLTPDGITYSGNPVMGLRTRELFGIGAQELIAFDTTSAYNLNNSNVFQTLPSVMPVTWNGSNSDFFFTTNYAGSFWATNSVPGLNGVAISAITTGATTTITTSTLHGFTSGQTVTFINVGGTTELNGKTGVITVTGTSTFTVPITTTNAYTSGGIALNSQVAITGQDGIRYYAQTTAGTTWVNYNPPIDPNNALAGALLIFPYRGYLVFLNTTEGNETGVQNFGQRARWTQIGTPYYSAPAPVTPDLQTIDPLAARDDIFGRGGANDAPTQEVITGANFIRDILVVYFERSTWRLRFVNNSQNPFVWERVNIELGSDSTFSTIPFDKGLMAVGPRGIIISDANDTIRIDEKIPDDAFDIRQSNQGYQRVYGIRTFKTKLCYWTYPSPENELGIFPDKVLVYNYDTRNWSYFDDTFTCFGYYYPTTLGPTWGDLIDAWSNYNDFSVSSIVSQEGEEEVIAGNQQGFVLSLKQTSAVNSASLYISAVTGSTITSPNNNLKDGTWITITGITGTLTDSLGYSLNGRNFKIANPTNNANNFTLQQFEYIDAGSFTGSIFNYVVDYVPIIPGSVVINVGTLQFVDTNLDGNLFGSDSTSTGTINYISGVLVLNFSSPIVATEIYINVVSYSPEQDIVEVQLTGTYSGGGLIAKISNFDIQTKIFNFFQNDKRARLSKIDFYTDATANGQFTCNVFADSSNVIINAPLPDNLQSNVVLTYPSQTQVGQGDESLFRLYADCWAQTIQLQLTLSDQQQAVNVINQEDVEIVAMVVTLKPGGRLV